MDPITGIGLVASVAQLVTFSIETASTVREVYQQGSVSSYNEVEYVTVHLSKLTGSLQQSLQSSHPHPSALSQDEKDLIELGRRCEGCAHKLQHELRKLTSQPRNSLLAATRITARAIWTRPKIEEISKQLANYKSTLETSILQRLTQQFDAQSLRNDECFASLGKGLQQVVTRLADSQTSLATLTAQESDQTRSHITTELQLLEQRRRDDRLCDEVRESLFYPDIFSRQEHVGHIFDGIEDSYGWIFHEPRKPEDGGKYRDVNKEQGALWDDFGAWLESGQGLYWINGKAGSGKSTLMNYICRHDRKSEYLKEWRPDRLLLTPSYFFWAAGSMLQKSIEGLLRSLIYQMLTECRELVNCFKVEPLHAWNENRLLNTLLSMLEQSRVPVAVCMFLDGLDEIDGRYDTVARMIKNLKDHTNIKICFSSRPLLFFEEAFNGALGLRLQDLTYRSIRAYVDVQLSDLIQQRVVRDKQNGHRVERFVDKIVERANGVFLWAVIAVRDVRDGLHGIADVNELAQTIESLPPEIESLFMFILNRIKPQDFGDAPFFYETVAKSEILEACITLRTQLLSHTAGLLELDPSSFWSEDWPRSRSRSLLDIGVNFLHRTVRDFLSDNDEAKLFLARKGSTTAQVHLAIARGRLAELAQFSDKDFPTQRCPPKQFDVLDAALQHVSLAERLVGAAQLNLMRSLKYRRYLRRYSSAHEVDIFSRTYTTEAEKNAFMIGEFLTSIDIVGMAAKAGMTFYICERLGIANASQAYTSDLPDLNDYCTNVGTSVVLRWTQPSQPEDSYESMEYELLSSNYRETLRKYLRLDSGVPTDSNAEMNVHTRMDTDPDNNPRKLSSGTNGFAETYLLSCCGASFQGLIRILLHAGANPMAVVAPVRPKINLSEPICFWETWTNFLQYLRRNDARNYHSSWVTFTSDSDLNFNRAPKTVFETTKVLLAHGADINFLLRPCYGFVFRSALKRQIPEDSCFDFEIQASAMFMLEECFNKEPEFRKFAAAVESVVTKPTRRLVKLLGKPSVDHSIRVDPTRLSPRECDILWPLVEEWEKTGHATDLEVVQSAVKRILTDHNPDWDSTPKERLAGDSEEESKEDSAEDIEEEVEAAARENDEESAVRALEL